MNTTLDDARILVMNAVREIPQLTPFGIGVHYTYQRRGRDAVASEIKKQQDELYTDHALRMVAVSADWITAHRKDINARHTSYYFKHVVEQWRRDAGDPDPYVHNGCFIAAGVGLGLRFAIDGPNVIFRYPTLRQRIDRELCGYGQRLRGNDIVETHTKGPLMLPCSPRVIEGDVDLRELARKMGVL
jgi:hypothetical protein